jgi:hypothetical protein
MIGVGLALDLALSQVISEEPREPAAEAPAVWRSSRLAAAISFGAAAWPGLRDMGRLEVPPGWAAFEDAGFAVTLAFLANAAALGRAELILGADLSLFTTRAGSPSGVPVDAAGQPAPGLWLLSSGTSISVDARLQPAAGPFRPYAAVGAGALNLVWSVDKPGFLNPATGTEVLDRWRPLLWLGLGADYRFGPPELCWGLFVEARVQFVDLGTVPGAAPSGGSLRGPIYGLALGGLIGWGH